MPEEELSSTLQHVQNVQGDDGEVSWANLHDKIVKWVGEAAYGQNLPGDKGREDLTQEVLMQVFRDISQFQVEPGASFSGWVRMVADRKLKDYWRRTRAQKRGSKKIGKRGAGAAPQPSGGMSAGVDMGGGVGGVEVGMALGSDDGSDASWSDGDSGGVVGVEVVRRALAVDGAVGGVFVDLVVAVVVEPITHLGA